MFCPRCGARNVDDANFCIKCGSNIQLPGGPSPQGMPYPPPPGYPQPQNPQAGSYEAVAETIGMVPSLNKKDNVFQGIFVLVGTLICVLIGLSMGGKEGALVGALVGLVASGVLSGLILMVAGLVRAAQRR